MRDESDRPAEAAPEGEAERFGARLKFLMVRKDWNQSDLARAAGIGRDSISAYVRGRYVPGALNVHKLAQALGVSDEDVLPQPKPVPVPPANKDYLKLVVPANSPNGFIELAKHLPVDVILEIVRIVRDADKAAEQR